MACKYDYLKYFCAFTAPMCDNIYFFHRIGVYNMPLWLGKLVTRLCAISTTCLYTMDMFDQYYKCKAEAKGNEKAFRKLMYDNKMLFVSKIAEYPVRPPRMTNLPIDANTLLQLKSLGAIQRHCNRPLHLEPDYLDSTIFH